MDQPPALEPQLVTPPPAPSTLAARLMNVLVAPGDVFDEIKMLPASMANWLVPAALFIVVGWVGAGLVFSQPALQHQMNEVAEKNIDKQIQKQHLSHDQAEQARQRGMQFAGLFSKAGAVAAPVFAGILTPIWWGLIIWLIGGKVFKGNFPFLKGVEVAGLANMVGVLGAILKILLILVTGNLFATPSLALLVKDFDPQNPLHGLLGVINVMTFWFLGVGAVAVARLSGASFAKAAAWTFGIWAAYTGLMVGAGFALQAIFAK